MPEGDTIFRTADVLRRALVGSVVQRAGAQPRPGLAVVPRVTRLAGRSVDAVEARGKHLLIGFSGGLWLRSHMQMRGAWHRYRPGEPWRLPRARASCWLETDDAVAVCFDCADVELLTGAQVARHRRLAELGPDLLAARFDAEEAVRRLRADPKRQLGVALLDQRSVAGIGNVYKSEICFIEERSPWEVVGSVSGPKMLHLVSTARRLLAANVDRGRRVTTGVPVPGRTLWVYGRAGRPCRRCGTPIRGRRQGELGRMTYWCPRCQAGPSASSG